MPRLNNRQCRTAIVRREGFSNSTGSFHGEWASYVSTGYSPQKVRDEIRLAVHPDGADPTERRQVYVVYSYDTPIAYAKKGEDLVVFDVKYSNTTSRHSSICRNA
jgi:hypothetical protein